MTKKLTCSCGSSNDVIDFYIDDKLVVMCADCRAEKLGKKIDTTGWERED